jgi:glycosyltransferase involved in cell wall biosynthesis
MKKILLISRCSWTLYNFRIGLMRKLKNQGVNVIGAGASGDGFEQKIRETGFVFIDLPINKKSINPLSDIYLLFKLVALFKKEKPDIVHLFTIKPVIYGGLAAKWARVPKTVVTITGLGYVFTTGKTWLRTTVEWLYKNALKHCQTVFFLNNEDKALFIQKKLVSVEKAERLPSEGINTTKFLPKYATSPQPARHFLMMARLIREKGVYIYAEAAKRIKEKYPEITFTLLGGRDIRNPSVVPEKDLLDWKKQGIIQWLGEVVDVREHIAQADVIVLPSYYREGIPCSLLEGAAMGKPLITTDAVGCREVVDDGVNGFLVPVQNSQALAAAMEKFINDVGLGKHMGLAGRKKICAEFDERIVIQKTFDAYGI